MSFADMKEEVRLNTVRAFLFATSSPASKDNQLFEWAKKRKGNVTETYNSTCFCILGQRLCLKMFIAIVQVSEKSIQYHARDVTQGPKYKLYISNSPFSRKGKLGVQTVLAKSYLHRFAQLNAFFCPRNRGADNIEEVIQLLPSDTSKVTVHKNYEKEWPYLITSAINECNWQGQVPETPLGRTSFGRVWKIHFPFLKIMNKGSDFCDTCIKYRNLIETFPIGTDRSDVESLLMSHRNHAENEFKFYRSMYDNCKENSSGPTVHVVIDFAEKALLPSLERQPGQLHFVSGLKFDFFAVSVSNLTCNEVLSMLYATLKRLKENEITKSAKHLVITADNCGGQNKNRWMLWFCEWLLYTEQYETVSLYFLVPGHTKNVCDGAFGCIKRLMRKSNIRTPKDMMEVINASAKSIIGISGGSIKWYNWKEFLEPFYRYPSNLKMNSYLVFKFSKDSSGSVEPLKYSDTTSKGKLYGLRKQKAHFGNHLESKLSENSLNSHVLTWKTLVDTPSPQHENRYKYLKALVIDRIFPNDNSMIKEFFEDGN